MTVSGPTQIPSAGTSPTDDGVERAGVKDVGHADGARGVGEELRTIDGASEARLSEPAAASHQPHRGVAVADLAREVDAGKLSPQLALERVMERVLDRHIDKSAPAATREQIRTALLDALESDPLLTEKLARLG